MRTGSFNLGSPEYILISGGISWVVLAALTSQSSQLIGGTGVQGHRLGRVRLVFVAALLAVSTLPNEDISGECVKLEGNARLSAGGFAFFLLSGVLLFSTRSRGVTGSSEYFNVKLPPPPFA